MKFHCQLAPIRRSACSRLLDRGGTDSVEGRKGPAGAGPASTDLTAHNLFAISGCKTQKTLPRQW